MLAIGTRFFGKDPAKDLPRISKFIEAALPLGKVFVAVNIAEDKCDTIGYCAEHFPEADVFAVTPWQTAVAPLNAIVYRAACMYADRLLIASSEFIPTGKYVALLLKCVDNDTLVAGARFPEHKFFGGRIHGYTLTVPWNTFAIWNLDLLASIGFPLVGDAAFDVEQAGVEEVSTISFYQMLSGFERAKAKIVHVPSFYEEWNMEGWDNERRTKHEIKMATKASRPAKQLAHTGWPAPFVHHIV